MTQIIPVHEDINIFTEYFPKKQFCPFCWRALHKLQMLSCAAYVTVQFLQIFICIKLFLQCEPAAYQYTTRKKDFRGLCVWRLTCWRSAVAREVQDSQHFPRQCCSLLLQPCEDDHSPAVGRCQAA